MKRLVILLFVLASMTAKAQESDFGNWLIYIGSKSIDSNWNIHHEVQYRNYDAITDLEQLLLRTGVGYNLTPGNNNVLLGYAYILSQNYVDGRDDKVDVNEHRIFQQFITKQKFSGITLQHRYRFEQRFMEEDFKLRFRYFLSVNVPLTNKEIVDNTLYLSAYNEIFINNEQVLFDRNRLYGGLGYKLNKNVKFELGYMNQFLNNANRDQLNIFALVNF